MVPSSCWSVEYFYGSGLQGPRSPYGFDACATSLNTVWGSGSPHPLLPVNGFSATFKRTFSGPGVLFNIDSDDGFRVLVDGAVIADKWDASIIDDYESVGVLLPAGDHTVEIQYREIAGAAALYVVDILPSVPFMKPNNPIGTTGGLPSFPNWQLDTFAAPGDARRSANSVWLNSMNMGSHLPNKLAVDGNDLYVGDVFRDLVKVDRNGDVQAVYPGARGMNAMTRAGNNKLLIAYGCSLQVLNTSSGSVNPVGGTCGASVTPGTYAMANVVFEGTIKDLAIDSQDRWYVLDEKYVWRSDVNHTTFTRILGSAADSGTVVDGAFGTEFFLRSPLSLAVSDNTVMVGEYSRLLKFDYDPADDQYGGHELIKPVANELSANAPVNVGQSSVTDVLSIEFLNDNEVLILENGRHMVRHLHLSTNVVSPAAGTGAMEGPFSGVNAPVPSASGLLGDPQDLVIGNNAIYISQWNHGLIKRIRGA